MTKRKTALIFVVFTWLVLEVVSWALSDWLSSNVNPENLSALQSYLKPLLSYLSSGFSLGFLFGALLFSVWDWPILGVWLRKQKEKYRNKESDEALAKECEELSQLLYENAAQVERLRNERHWQASRVDSSDDIHKSWTEARQAEARDEERIRRQHGHRVQNVLVRLKSRGIKMDLWGFSLSHHDLTSASYFFSDIANSLREGTYLEKEFKAGHVGLPVRM
ncbi:hypothetical protein NB501_04580 [Vibrio alginolyticus]|uniref:hypothetical protein n=1 Tax=Vibrio alginolyticus TaxID=663 RepID=UPI00215CC994|nr:hypothetical protein [Vibrio alginolyticus]MCR9574721.1 hypothetical protein [Vibrio alginolyticus]